MIDLMWRFNGALRFSRAVREPAQRIIAALRELPDGPNGQPNGQPNGRDGPNGNLKGTRPGKADGATRGGGGGGGGGGGARGQLPIGDRGYVALHVRMEEDWLEHCEGWKSGDNCLTNTEVRTGTHTNTSTSVSAKRFLEFWI